MKLIHTFEFAAAHSLPNVPRGHKCSRVHGHTYTVELHLEGPVVEPQGWVVDFGAVKLAWSAVHDQLDHYLLNGIVANPTAENLAKWVAAELITDSTMEPYLRTVVVWETPHAAAVYEVPA